GARYYAPWLGRWTATDPIGLRDGPNTFLYCYGNPVPYSDPSGLLVPDEALPAEEDSTSQATAVPRSEAGEGRLWNDTGYRRRITDEGARLLARDRRAVGGRVGEKVAGLGDLAQAAGEGALSKPGGGIFG